MKLLAAAAAAFTLLAASSGAMAAVIYDAGDEFNGAQGGSSGVWSYGMVAEGTFTPLTYIAGSNVFGRPGANFDTPLVGSPDGDGALLMHPGEFGELIVLRFTAPTADTYSAQISAYLADSSCGGCGGTDGVIANLNGTALTLDRPNGYAPQTLGWSGFLDAGQTIDFTLDPRSNYGWDSTRVSEFVTAAAVPEPMTWALLIMGFGGLGMALRANRHLIPAAA